MSFDDCLNDMSRPRCPLHLPHKLSSPLSHRAPSSFFNVSKGPLFSNVEVVRSFALHTP